MSSAHFRTEPHASALRKAERRQRGISSFARAHNYPVIYSRDPDPSEHGTALCCF